MNRIFTALSAVLIFALLFGSLPITAQAQEPKSFRSTPIDPRSDEYQIIKESSLNELMSELGKEEGEERGNTDFEVLSMNRDEFELVHTKFQQNYRGIPVFGAEAIVHLDKDGKLFNVTNDIAPEVDETCLVRALMTWRRI